LSALRGTVRSRTRIIRREGAHRIFEKALIFKAEKSVLHQDGNTPINTIFGVFTA